MIKIPMEFNSKRDEVNLWKSTDIDDPKLKEVISRLKNVCNLFGTGFTVKDFTSNNEPKNYKNMIDREQEEASLQDMNESIILEGLYGSSKRSYFKLGEAKMVIEHSGKVNEEIHGARSRNIDKIFIISPQQEKFKYPVKHLPSARSMTRHIGNGGCMGDKVGKHITDSAKELMSYRSLVKDKSPLQHHANGYMDEIRDMFRKMQTGRGYRLVVEQIQRMPRVGKKLIEKRMAHFESRCPLIENEESKNALRYLAKRDILEGYQNAPAYRRVLESCNLGLPPNEVRKAANRLARGELTVSEPVSPLSITDPREFVKKQSLNLKNVVNDEPIAKALVIMSDSKPTDDILQFIKRYIKIGYAK